MNKKSLIGVLTLVLVFLVAVGSQAATPGTITTTFTSNNGGAGNMFDVYAKEDIQITGFDVNVDQAGVVDTIQVYYKVGTYVGFETTPGAWTLLGEDTVTSAGQDVPTHVAVGGLTIPAGMTYGFYVTVDDFGGGFFMPYTNGTAGGDVFSNAQVDLSTGAGLGPLFGGFFEPRIWNGTLYYNYDLGSGEAETGGESTTITEPVPGPDMVEIPSTAVVGAVAADTPVYFAPQAGAATGTTIEAGKTLWVYGVDASGGFYKVMLSGKFFWLPVSSMGPNYDNVWQGTPLPTDVVD